MQQEIGIVTIEYDKEGKIVSSEFVPTMKVKTEEKLLRQLQQGNFSSEVVKKNADLIFASFFSKINDIELADRDIYEVASEIVNCEKYEDGKVKKCEIRYIFKEI